MDTFRKAVIVFLVFLIGTAAALHVDRQGQQMYAAGPALIEKVENFIEMVR